MRALTAEQRADREHDARVKRWSASVKSAQKAVAEYKLTEAKVIAKNDSERRRIDAECDARRAKWDARLVELERELDRALAHRPIQSYTS